MPAFNGTAVVTGASSGIGRALALALASRGAHLHLCGRSDERLQHVAERATSKGSEVSVHSVDLADPHALSDWPLPRDLESLDLLAHCAGALALGSIADTAASDLEILWRVNVRAPILLTRSFLPALRARSGRVVLVNSTAGRTVPPGAVAYAASKHALRAFADGLRAEEGPNGVRVLSVFPGRTATPMQEDVVAWEGGAYRPDDLLQPEDVARAIVDALELPETADLTELTLRPAKPPAGRSG